MKNERVKENKGEVKEESRQNAREDEVMENERNEGMVEWDEDNTGTHSTYPQAQEPRAV